MRVLRPAFCILLVCTLAKISFAQQPNTAPTPSRDPLAVAALQQAISAMGGTAPSDSIAKGTITITAGSRTESGTFSLLTRGATQSSEQIAATYTNQTLNYSNGLGASVTGQAVQTLSMEGSMSGQSAVFPLPFLVNALSDLSLNCQTMGLETTDSSTLLHLQFWHGFANTPKLQVLASFTLVDIWLDPATNLPARISYGRRDGGGDTPTLLIDVYYSDYKNYGGILYPMTVQESLNGTPWAVIALQSVVFNTGLSDSGFPVE